MTKFGTHMRIDLGMVPTKYWPHEWPGDSNTSQCELRALRVNSGMLNVIRIATYYTAPPLESPDSFWITMAFSL